MSNINPAAVDWAALQAKRENDREIFNCLLPVFLDCPKIRMLSFPAATWVYESALAETFSSIQFICHGLERDHIVYNKAYDYVLAMTPFKSNNVKFIMWNHPGDFYSIFTSVNLLALVEEQRSYDYIYFDWMGTWSQEKKRDVRLMFEKAILKSGGLFQFTISLSRGMPVTLEELQDAMRSKVSFSFEPELEDKLKEVVKEEGVYKYKTKGLTKEIAIIANEYGKRIHLLHFSDYMGLGNGRELSFLMQVFDK